MSKAIDKFREGMSEDGDVDAEVFNDLCDHAETLEEERDDLKTSNALLETAIKGHIATVRAHIDAPASEWLTLPWGGVVRKSEVSAALKHTDGMGVIHVRVWRGQVAHESYGNENSVCDEWLADIERQLGIER